MHILHAGRENDLSKALFATCPRGRLRMGGVGVYGRLLYMASVPALGLKSPYSQLTPFVLSCPPKLSGVNFCGYSMFIKA